MILSVQDVLRKGLAAAGIGLPAQQAMSHDKRMRLFRKHFGSSPLDLADQWYDLCHTDIPLATLSDAEKTDKGFQMFMMAHHFLWTYTKNAALLATRFRVNEKYAQGDHLWKWIHKIAGLEQKKIVWPENLPMNDVDLFFLSVDNTDCKTREPKTPDNAD